MHWLQCLRTGLPELILELLPRSQKTYVVGMNKDKGVDTRKVCSNGCIGCKKCERVCEFGAITVENNCAHIDPEKCTNCGKCAEGCPVHCGPSGEPAVVIVKKGEVSLLFFYLLKTKKLPIFEKKTLETSLFCAILIKEREESALTFSFFKFPSEKWRK